MSITGLCQICESARARHSCARCGALVCEDHYEPERGMCMDCAKASGLGDEDVSPEDIYR